MDFQQILLDLQKQAKQAAKEHDLEGKLKKGKDLGEAALERLKTDRNTQIAAAGAGALITAMLLGTKGGRRFIGGTAKTGAVAGLGALAYHAWMKSQGQKPDASVEPAQLGYVTAKKAEPEFAEALVRTIVAAAWADGVLDEAEKVLIDGALKEAGVGGKDRAILENARPEAETLDKIAAGALSPNHAAQLYTAACVVTGDPTAEEAGFLARLAARLGIAEAHAAAIRAEAKG
ncbi:MAG: DUF533 domain-containing protein [Hyphomonas sp.]|uniref:tellurite resistance TerB family protein n=1 Tax=Hyphomonas sp. TaxID=87 RepID=UPI0025B7EFFC|nr:DUF533 domain-containing protein [Hyphomonas sp.]MBA4337720.1 DUF533 domain-containing protein [Hyphomonas sp.]